MLNVTKVYERVENAINKKIYKIFVLRGGTRSSKTYSLLQLFFKRLLTGNLKGYYRKKWKLDIVRKFSATLRATAWLDFIEIKEDYLDDENVDRVTKNMIRKNMIINRNEMIITFFWRTIHFIGADNRAKLKWWKRDLLYCNEASELQYKTEFYQLLMRTKDLIFIDFNPDDQDIWINTEIEQKRVAQRWDVFVDVSTYRDNWFLTKSQKDEIRYMKHTDKQLRLVYWLGQYGVLKGRIFQFDVQEVPEDAEFLLYWQDFWFTNHPTALCWIRKKWKHLRFDQLIYETWLTNPDICDLYSAIWVESHEEIIADSAEPKSIEEICSQWWNIKPCVKGADSINYWIMVMKTYHLHVTPWSDKVIKEFKKYVWITDKNGNSLNKPVDKHNHAIDGIRYWIVHALSEENDAPNIF